MWFPESRVRVWLYRRPTDMRRSFDGLSAMVKRELGEESSDGALYVFVNRRKTLMKVLYFDRSGYCVWSKRLEQGRFQVRFDGSNRSVIDLTALKLIVEGIDTGALRRYKRYQQEGNRRRVIETTV